MARCSFSNAKLFSTLVIDNFSLAFSRRTYAAASQGMAMSNSSNLLRRGGGSSSTSTSSTEDSWVPDPVTGYYRPANHADDVDVAELREMLLTTSNPTKFNRSSN
uniref:Late embryogenesis abundant protein n=1 Tax=Reaumuria trigyna TaxID=1091135 RepID=A0A075C704_9CARY|nr:late embryogenesis abundant protein [Reaumuria trigyna]